jgi:hypothetical protein
MNQYKGMHVGHGHSGGVSSMGKGCQATKDI